MGMFSKSTSAFSYDRLPWTESDTGMLSWGSVLSMKVAETAVFRPEPRYTPCSLYAVISIQSPYDDKGLLTAFTTDVSEFSKSPVSIGVENTLVSISLNDVAVYHSGNSRLEMSIQAFWEAMSFLLYANCPHPR